MKLNLSGELIPSDWAEIYRKYGYESGFYCPDDVRKAIQDLDPGEELTLEINSIGGSVIAGIAKESSGVQASSSTSSSSSEAISGAAGVETSAGCCTATGFLRFFFFLAGLASAVKAFTNSAGYGVYSEPAASSKTSSRPTRNHVKIFILCFR